MAKKPTGAPPLMQGKTSPDREPDGTFKRGSSGNPRGRPSRVRYLSEAMRDVLGQHPDALGDDPETCADAVAAATVRKAMRGVISATEILRDSTEGRPGVRGGGAVGLVGMLLALPPRDEPIDDFGRMIAESAVRAGLSEPEAALLEAAPGEEEPAPLEAEEPEEPGEAPDEGPRRS